MLCFKYKGRKCFEYTSTETYGSQELLKKPNRVQISAIQAITGKATAKGLAMSI